MVLLKDSQNTCRNKSNLEITPDMDLSSALTPQDNLGRVLPTSVAVTTFHLIMEDPLPYHKLA